MDSLDYNSSDVSGRDGSDSESTQSTPEEERIRRLFITCDRDGDGFITSDDILSVCHQLNLEYSAKEIMEQLGANEGGRISFNDFVKRRLELLDELKLQTESVISSEDERPWYGRGTDIAANSFQRQILGAEGCSAFEGNEENPSNPGSCSEDEGAMMQWKVNNTSVRGSDSASRSIEASSSAKHESSSWEFYSGAHDLDGEPNLQKLIEISGHTVPQERNDLLELANKLHMSALSSVKQELFETSSRLQLVLKERDLLEKQTAASKKEQMRLVKELEKKRHKDCQKYEDKITELNSLIAEMSEKLELQEFSMFNEEDEYNQTSEDECGPEPKIKRTFGFDADTTDRKVLLRKKNEEIRRLEDVSESRDKVSSEDLQLNEASNIDAALNSCIEMIMSSDDKEHICECVQLAMEKLKFRILHMQSQLDLNNIHLDEYKANCERLTVFLGKYESNNTALTLALSYADKLLEGFDVLNSLLESEMGLLLASCRAAGLGKIANASGCEERDEVASIFLRAKEKRNSCELKASQFMQKVKEMINTATSPPTAFAKDDEDSIRLFLSDLQTDLQAIRKSIVYIESLHEDSSISTRPTTSISAQKLDLENVILMQEMMSLKEEKADLKSQMFILEKEKKALQLRLGNLQRRSERDPTWTNSNDMEAQSRRQVNDLMLSLNQMSETYEEAVSELKQENGSLKGKLERLKKKNELRTRKLSPENTVTQSVHHKETVL